MIDYFITKWSLKVIQKCHSAKYLKTKKQKKFTYHKIQRKKIIASVIH